MQVHDPSQHDVFGTPPARRVADERDSEPAGNEAQQGGLIHGLLHDAWGLQAAAGARLHESVVVGGTLAPRKPNKVGIGQVAQAEALQLRQGIPLRRGEHEPLRGDLNLIQLRVGLRHVEDVARIQPARANGLDLVQGAQRAELQFSGGLPLAELPE